MAVAFKDEEFQNTCRELEEPQVEGWEFFVESHGVTIYRLYNETSGLYQYKIYGVLDDVLPEICADVYMDLEYRRQWDTYAKELRETGGEGHKLVYWQVNFPFPLWNRDYVYHRELRTMEYGGKKIWVVLARSEATPDVPEKPGVVRVDDYIQSAALTTDGKVGTKAYMRYYDNPKGNIPTWLINWAAKTGVPQFLTIMQNACRGYPDYLSSNYKNKNKS
ncbi:phosphatidylcholine transfer protein-like [Babylonia areolata]|uniref:phosphatidylcholine transfer protein-like n=1 Tax=Babylonia areolata TaxID=304850 RepID=UPI003FD12CF9